MLTREAYNRPSQKMATTDIFFLVLRCRFLITSNGKPKVKMSRATSIAAMDMVQMPMSNVVFPCRVQKLDIGRAEKIADYSMVSISTSTSPDIIYQDC